MLVDIIGRVKINNIKLTINIIANRITEESTLSGGERIFIEFARRWAQRGHQINIFTSREGGIVCSRYNLDKGDNIRLIQWSGHKDNKHEFSLLLSVLVYVYRTVEGSLKAIKISKNTNDSKSIIFSSSPFWPDLVPSLLMKKRTKKARLIVGFYLFAPNPFKGGYGTWYKNRFQFSTFKDWSRALALWINHLPVYWLVKKYADVVFVTNEMDRHRFITRKLVSDRVIAVQGGVDTKTPMLVKEPKNKEYDAVFIGRFHPQKGVLELIDIWRYVCKIRKNAKLAMIGNGPLGKDVEQKIDDLGLKKNVNLYGFKDGVEKIRIFKSSRVVLHPAVYDSGGMAACEAMVCGLPGVSFDLPALKTYYPKGMIKTPVGDLKKFAENIINLLEDKELYKKIRKDAIDWAQNWDWDKRADNILDKILKIFGWTEGRKNKLNRLKSL